MRLFLNVYLHLTVHVYVYLFPLSPLGMDLPEKLIINYLFENHHLFSILVIHFSLFVFPPEKQCYSLLKLRKCFFFSMCRCSIVTPENQHTWYAHHNSHLILPYLTHYHYHSNICICFIVLHQINDCWLSAFKLIFTFPILFWIWYLIAISSCRCDIFNAHMN